VATVSAAGEHRGSRGRRSASAADRTPMMPLEVARKSAEPCAVVPEEFNSRDAAPATARLTQEKRVAAADFGAGLTEASTEQLLPPRKVLSTPVSTFAAAADPINSAATAATTATVANASHPPPAVPLLTAESMAVCASSPAQPVLSSCGGAVAAAAREYAGSIRHPSAAHQSQHPPNAAETATASSLAAEAAAAAAAGTPHLGLQLLEHVARSAKQAARGMSTTAGTDGLSSIPMFNPYLMHGGVPTGGPPLVHNFNAVGPQSAADRVPSATAVAGGPMAQMGMLGSFVHAPGVASGLAPYTQGMPANVPPSSAPLVTGGMPGIPFNGIFPPGPASMQAMAATWAEQAAAAQQIGAVAAAISSGQLGGKIHTCQHCGRSYSRASDLRLHLRSHTGEKPFKCKFCNKSFKKNSHRERHEFIHTGAKPYSCGTCGKSYTRPGDLKTHLRVHTGERPYVCQVCSKTFITSSHMSAHVAKEHGSSVVAMPYKCDKCNRRFTTRGGLSQHASSHDAENADRVGTGFRKVHDLEMS